MMSAVASVPLESLPEGTAFSAHGAAMIKEADEVESSVGTTITQYVLSTARKRLNSLQSDATRALSRHTEEDVQDLITLLNSITLAVKTVGAQVRCAGIPGSRAAASDAQELNKNANQIWIDGLLYSQKSSVLVSEELEDPVIVQKDMQGKFAVVFDPLTGLSDPPAQDMGAIFGVFYQLSGSTPGVTDVMQPARNLIAAGYALYGSCTVLMFSVGEGLHQFTLDASLNEFIMTKHNVRIPYCGNIYSINEGYTSEYDRETQEMLKCLKTEPALDGRARTCRYIGSMVADIHRTVLKGGIFMYPPHTRGYPNGRLKLLYEAGPMAFLVEQAGGQASTGTKQICEICPDSIHTRVPVFLGSEDDVNLATGFYKKTPWGAQNKDPMFKLRRTLSIEEKNAEKKGSVIEEDDGIICFHLG